MWTYLVIINVVTFIVFGLDKYLAIKKKWRISEKTLFLLSLIGGCYLEFLGMFVFRHKTKKTIFYIFNIIMIVANSFIFGKYL